MESKFARHINRDEIVDIVCELVRQNTVNPPVNEYLCKRLNTNRTQQRSKRAGESDVLLNAVNILNTSGALAEVSIEEDGLEYWKRIYSIGQQI